MCGRYTLTTPPDLYQAVFRLDLHHEITARYNIAPTQQAPVIRTAPGSLERESVMMRWGLVPSWSKDIAIGNRLINARTESACDKPSFRSAWKSRRCIVPADGFYEWQPHGKVKQPFHIHMRDNEPFAFAGLWESWIDGAGQPIETYTILTCEASENIRALHSRMPVIVPAEARDVWLTGPAPDPQALIEQAHDFANALVFNPVSRVVNNARNDSPECIRPIGNGKQVN